MGHNAEVLKELKFQEDSYAYGHYFMNYSMGEEEIEPGEYGVMIEWNLNEKLVCFIVQIEK